MASWCQLCGVDFFIARLRPVDEEYTTPIDHIAGPGSGFDVGYSVHRISLKEMDWCKDFRFLLKNPEDWGLVHDDRNRGRMFLTGTGENLLYRGVRVPYDMMTPPASSTNGRPRYLRYVSPTLEESRFGPDSLTNISQSAEASQDGVPGLGFHPHCYEIFKKVSLLRLRSIDVQGLWYLRFVRSAFYQPLFDVDI